jgi:hypothetical protein
MIGRRTRRLAALVATIALAGSLAACATPDAGDQDAATAVSAEESELLAVMRFRNFDAGTREVSFAVDDAGAPLAFEGWFDWTTGVGYGSLSDDGVPNSLLLWNAEAVGAHEPVADGSAPLPIPDADALATAWSGAALDASGSRLHALLAIIATLGVDRPDNPLLLRQGGALRLGAEQLGDVQTTVFAGPLSDGPLPSGQALDAETATVRYWVDADGLLRRMATRLGGSAEWTTVEFGEATGSSLGDPFADAGGAQ